MSPEKIARYCEPDDEDDYHKATEAMRGFVGHLFEALKLQYLEHVQIQRALLEYAIHAAETALIYPVRGLPPSIADGLETPEEWYRRDILHEGWGHP